MTLRPLGNTPQEAALIEAVYGLLSSTELNLDELEPETRAAIQAAAKAVQEVQEVPGLGLSELGAAIAESKALAANRSGSKREFYRTTLVVTVLSEEPMAGDESLRMIAEEMVDGIWSGEWTVAGSETLGGPEAAWSLSNQGSDPGFFRLDEQGGDLDAEEGKPGEVTP